MIRRTAPRDSPRATEPERRQFHRWRQPLFIFHRSGVPVTTIAAEDGSTSCARFRAADAGSLTCEGEFLADGRWYSFSGAEEADESPKGRPGSLLLRYHVTKARVDDREGRRAFLLAEYEQQSHRIDVLAQKDKENVNQLMKLFSFLIIYAAAPFSFPNLERGFLRVLAVGGCWLSATVWYLLDRNFRAYGRHLMERTACAHQVAVVRALVMEGQLDYMAHTLTPVGTLARQGPRGSFQEHIDSPQVDWAGRFFKFVSVFPCLGLVLFVSMLIDPSRTIGAAADDAFRFLLRSACLLSFGLFFWLRASWHRCFDLHKAAFAARRISASEPWPRFPDDDVRDELRKRLYWEKTDRLLKGLAFVLVAGNLFLGIHAVFMRGPDEMWSAVDVVAGIATLVGVLTYIGYSEYHLHVSLQIAKKLWPTTQPLRLARTPWLHLAMGGSDAARPSQSQQAARGTPS